MSNQLTPLQAIRAKCLDCCGNERNEAKMCTANDCPLWTRRPGQKATTRTQTEEQKELSRARMQTMHANKMLGRSESKESLLIK